MEKIDTLLNKYNHFRYEQIRSIEQREDGAKIVTLVVIDEEGEDTDSVALEFTDVTASKILVNDVLSYLDMTSGITLIKENDLYGFAVGSGSAMLQVNSAPLYVVAKNLNIIEN